ncbi:LysR family transcriptional regulator [Sediminibacillus halophilus]|uniref:DNA-binding transcriptional regulator, LysR family n=1 Tax=Sediminibacillus halophilus TaxID=482461 RepID=A0A1G9T751_9BACI|nr:LysR family transcriptional regulator [Sediminibacillus halophilus]SDM43579.1 DNA-binding transcriptional regulator, LysR family [Sediminibacillus halophilus]
MELTDLKIFLTVADEGNFSKGAEKLGYVQSNVTNRIKKLESELGVTLYNRHPKGVSLTERGLIFYEHAASISKRAKEAIAAVQDTDNFGGKLAIGVVETLASNKFMNILSDFQVQYPNVSISLITGTSPKLLEMIQKYKLDAAFITGQTKPDFIEIEYTIQDVVSLITKKDFKTEQTPKTWAVFPEGCPFRRVLVEWLDSNGEKPTNFIEVSTLDTLLNCVKSGLASAVLPESVINRTQEMEYNSIPLPKEYRLMETHLVRRKGLETNRILSSFIQKINESNL